MTFSSTYLPVHVAHVWPVRGGKVTGGLPGSASAPYIADPICPRREQISNRPWFRLVTGGDELPVFALTTSAEAKGWDVFALSRALRERGWQVPAYTFPVNRTDLSVLRIVCRHGFSLDMADLLLEHIDAAVTELRDSASLGGASGQAAFHH